MELVLSTLSLALSLGLAVFYFRDRKRSAFELETAYCDNLLEWHASVVNVLMRLRFYDRPHISAEHVADLAELSSLIEQGRFYFPNIDRGDSFGADKPIAYRGYRNLALDFLVASYNVLRTPADGSRSADAERLQRYFTSIIFEVVRPAERLEAIRTHTDRYFVVQKCFDDFLAHKDGHVIDHIWQDQRFSKEHK